MSDTETSGSAPAAVSASPDTGASESNQSKPVNSAPQPGGVGSSGGKDVAGAKQASAEKAVTQARELGETDLDALVTVKVNGESKKVPLRQAMKWAQLGDSAYQKMKEAAAEKSQAQQLIRLAKENPREFYRVTGHDPRGVSEKLLLEELEHDALTPEQKELKELKAWRAQQEKARQDWEDEQAKTKEQAEYSKLNHSMRNEFVQAWSDSGLPEDPEWGARIAATIVREQKLGNELSAKEAAAIVKERFHAHNRNIYSKLDPQALEESLGVETLKKWRDHDVKRVTQKAPQASQSQTPRPPGSGASTPKQKTQKPMNEREWAEHFASL